MRGDNFITTASGGINTDREVESETRCGEGREIEAISSSVVIKLSTFYVFISFGRLLSFSDRLIDAIGEIDSHLSLGLKPGEILCTTYRDVKTPLDKSLT